MEDVLEVYTRPEDPQHPLVCMDELSQQLVSETRLPLPLAPGCPRRYDYEYRREGVCNIFMVFTPLLGQRWVTVTAQRTYQDWAHLMRDLVDIRFPDAERITLVLDNLNTHVGGALYETFEPAEAKRILDKLEFHYTPKHGSWLNMAEIELRVLNGQCLDRRLGSVRRVKQETLAWETERNADQATVNWRFTTADARIKLKRLYPMTQPGTSTLGALPKRPAAKLAATEAASRARRRAHKKDRAKHALHSLGT
jgi:transposase